MGLSAISADTWSAIAAMFSAITAFIALRLQSRSEQLSIAPILDIERWRSYSGKNESWFEAAELRNLGSGVAYDITITIDEGQDERVRAASAHIPVIGPGERSAIDFRLCVSWLPHEDLKPVALVVWAFDRQGASRRTDITLIVSPNDIAGVGHQPTAGLIVAARSEKRIGAGARAIMKPLRSLRRWLWRKIPASRSKWPYLRSKP